MKEKKEKKAFGLVEVLFVLLIFTSVILTAVSIMIRSARTSINNDISSRAKTIAVKVLEIAKSPDGEILDCNTGNKITLGGSVGSTQYYSIGTIDYNNTNLNSACFSQQIDNAVLNTIVDRYKVEVVFPSGGNYLDYNEKYYLQLKVEDDSGSKYSKLTLTTIYTDLTGEEINFTLYGFRPNPLYTISN